MRTIIIIGALLLLPAFISARSFDLDNGNITFEAPDGFNPLTQEQINRKYPSSRAPRFVVGTSNGSTSIAYDLKPHRMHQNQLYQAKAAMTAQFNQIIPGIQWKKNEIIELSGQKWILFEFISTAADTDIYNILLMTGYGNQTIMFNFNSIMSDYRKYEKHLRGSLNSIRIN